VDGPARARAGTSGTLRPDDVVIGQPPGEGDWHRYGAIGSARAGVLKMIVKQGMVCSSSGVIPGLLLCVLAGKG
jgi:hypothetical protein